LQEKLKLPKLTEEGNLVFRHQFATNKDGAIGKNMKRKPEGVAG